MCEYVVIQMSYYSPKRSRVSDLGGVYLQNMAKIEYSMHNYLKITMVMFLLTDDYNLKEYF